MSHFRSFLLQKYLAPLCLTVLLSPYALADDFTKVLTEFREMMKDPDSGYLAVQKQTHKHQVLTFINILSSDVAALTSLFDMGYTALVAIEQSLKEERQAVEREYEDIRAGSRAEPNRQLISQLIYLAQKARRLEEDESKIRYWRENLLRDVNALLAVIEDPCSAERMAFAKQAFNMSGLFQRHAIRLDNFGKDAKAFFAEVFGGLLPDFGTQAPMHGGYAFGVGYANGVYSIDGKLPYLSGTDSKIASYGVAALGGVAFTKLASEGAKYLGTATAEVLLAELIGPQLAAQLAGVASTAVMGVGVAIMAYTVGKMLYNALGAFDEANKQRQILREINDIIKSLPGEAESAVLVDQYCRESLETARPQLSGLLEMKLALSALQNIEALRHTQLSAVIWSDLENRVDNLTPIEVNEIRKSIRTGLKLSERTAGLGAAWNRIIKRSIERKLPLINARDDLDEMNQMELELWAESQEVISNTLGARAQQSLDLISEVRKEYLR